MKPNRLQKHSKTQNDDDQREFQPKISTSSLKTQITSMMKENREPKFTAPPPPFLTEIRKMHYVCIYIYDIIHKYETLNVNKVNSKENTDSFKAVRAKQT